MADSGSLLQTPLSGWHGAHGAKLVDFAGWEMPVVYSGIVEEHMAVRERAGLFDVSHMGRLFVRGAGAEALLQRLFSNDLRRIAAGQGQYTLCLNEDGGVHDDLIVFRLEEGFLVVMNAGNRDKILGHVRGHAGKDVDLEHASDRLAMIACQGRAARQLVVGLDPAAGGLRRFAIGVIRLAGARMLATRTGYTGEDGFELYPEAGRAVAVWEALLEAGKGMPVAPCGLGARDGLRLEAGYPLYGHEIDESTSPWEAGLGWAVRMDKGDFIGRAALAKLDQGGPRKRQVAFTCAGPGIPRQGCPLAAGNQEVGKVVSGTFSPCLKLGIGIGYTAQGGAVDGVVIRGRALPVTAVKLPFYRSESLAGMKS